MDRHRANFVGGTGILPDFFTWLEKKSKNKNTPKANPAFPSGLFHHQIHGTAGGAAFNPYHSSSNDRQDACPTMRPPQPCHWGRPEGHWQLISHLQMAGSTMIKPLLSSWWDRLPACHFFLGHHAK
jgi:hypothetical protein